MNVNPFIQNSLFTPPTLRSSLGGLNSNPSSRGSYGSDLQFGSVTGNFNDPDRINQSSQPSTIGQRPMIGQSPMGGIRGFGSDRGILSSLGSLGGLTGFAEGGNVDKNDIGVRNFADKNGGIVDGLPRMFKSSPDEPMTYLSYITGEEQNFLRQSNIHGKDDPNRIGQPGPKGVPSFDDPGGDTEDQGSDFSGGDDSSSNNDGSDNNNDSGQEDTSDSYDADMGTDPGTGGDGSDNDDDDDAQDYTDGSGTQDTGNIQDSLTGDYTGGGGDNQDDRPLTNIVNVGAGSNLQYNPQFTADNLEDRGLDPKGFMSPENYAQTTQSQAASQAEMNDAMAIDQAINQAPAANLAANIVSTYNPQQYGLGS
jgi:hypothetical protein